jgi:TPR repeat protein
MIRRLVAIAGAMLMTSQAVRAQTTTADGVDAFLRGDYSRAAEILTPLVSPTRPPDHAAEFFLAAMHENGLGVPVDPMRACVLYARVAADNTAVFAAQAGVLLNGVSQLLGPDEVKECLAPPASPAHDDPDSESATVSEVAAGAPKIRGG